MCVYICESIGSMDRFLLESGIIEAERESGGRFLLFILNILIS